MTNSQADPLSEASIDSAVRTLEALADELCESIGARAQEGGGGPTARDRDLLRCYTRVIASLLGASSSTHSDTSPEES